MPTKSFLPGLVLAFCAVASLCSVAAERRASAHSNNASTTLIETASQQYAEGQLDQAAATLERALHIQPNNPATLHYLGVLRLQQGEYQQAETLAARSNLRVGRNVQLRNRNLQLIQAAQQAQITGTPPNAEQDRVAVQQGLKEQALAERESQPQPEFDAMDIPRGHWPPPGKCRIWFADRPPGHQPAPGSCKKLKHQVPFGAYLVGG
ncbi:tetratricopeptide repeat protein [Pseudomonas alkylphenolica]|uniref:Tetratricopeptide repeat domain protein n=1 Tax=Pseudomonas alkylphenolica TaxID=237609 RepID=A0A077FD58_9PSED|nr:tetratricopeptide repeat protein [Pseudomonas alkylphenolica]AIL61231.1 tetratricopeptide repeat domain protein [Pseudomonas alkylphenolica]